MIFSVSTECTTVLCSDSPCRMSDHHTASEAFAPKRQHLRPSSSLVREKTIRRAANPRWEPRHAQGPDRHLESTIASLHKPHCLQEAPTRSKSSNRSNSSDGGAF